MFHAYFLGYASIVCWIFAQLPQIYMNARRGNAENLSIPFILLWFTGDTMNYIGCILTEQKPFQVYLSIYFCVVDFILLLQCVSFREINTISPTPLLGALTHPVAALVTAKSSMMANYYAIADKSPDLGELSPEGINLLEQILAIFPVPDPAFVGFLTSWLCAAFYLSSRIPQIWRNFTTKSTEGLSMLMFFLAVMGNVFYALGILLDDHKNLVTSAPFLVGATGTLIFDLVIYLQHRAYRLDGYEIVTF